MSVTMLMPAERHDSLTPRCVCALVSGLFLASWMGAGIQGRTMESERRHTGVRDLPTDALPALCECESRNHDIQGGLGGASAGSWRRWSSEHLRVGRRDRGPRVGCFEDRKLGLGTLPKIAGARWNS